VEKGDMIRKILSLLVILLIFISIFAFQVQKAFAIETAWGSTLLLSSGSGTFESVSAANPTIYVSPGQLLSGTVTLIANNNIPPNCVVPLIGTSSWGENSNSWWLIHPCLPYGSSTQTASVNLQAPSEAGTYYIIFAFRGELTGAQMASATNWNVGYLVWNDGNDIADFSSTQISEAQQNGVTVVNWLYAEGYLLTYTPACAITVVVSGTPVHDVAVTGVVASQSQVTVGDSLHVSVFVENFGMQTETFSVTAYRISGKIGFDTEAVTLVAGETRTLDMVWDTTGVVPDIYQIGAYASQVPGETNLANNDYVDGIVRIDGVPYPPENLLASRSISSIILKWDPPKNPPSPVLGYYIFRGTYTGGESYYSQVDGATSNYEDSSVETGIIYYYYVMAKYATGLSRASNEVMNCSQESIKGICNIVTFDALKTKAEAEGRVSLFSIQQNLAIPIKFGQDNTLIDYYWAQNVIYYARIPSSRNCVLMGGGMLLFRTWLESGWKTKLVESFPPSPSGSVSPVMGQPKSIITIMSTIEDNKLVMKNDYCSHTFELKYFSSSTEEPYLGVYPWGQWLACASNSPELVIVGFGAISIGETIITGSMNVDFTYPTKGSIQTKFKVGNSWVPGINAESVPYNGASCAETSTGLKWEESKGTFEYNAEYESTGRAEEGFWFKPNLASFVTPPVVSPSGYGKAMVTEVHCPAYLSVYDSSGRHTGFNKLTGEVDAEIPDTVPLFNETIILFNPLDTYYITIVGTGNGQCIFKISWLQNATASILWNSTEIVKEGSSKSWIASPSSGGDYLVNEELPLYTFMSPLSASILVSQSVTFTSSVSGGFEPYSFQWFLNGNPVSGATSNTWTFTPTSSGIYYVYLKVTDAIGNTKQSDTARITVATVPVGGYSIPIPGQVTEKLITPYLILTAFLTIAFTTIKRRTTRKPKKT